MKTLLGIAAIAAAVVVPASSFAASFAYVNTAGEVTTVDAADANTALMTAPSIGMHSGVMMLNSSTDDIVGDKI